LVADPGITAASYCGCGGELEPEAFGVQLLNAKAASKMPNCPLLKTTPSMFNNV
jgi:hypothetical protein